MSLAKYFVLAPLESVAVTENAAAFAPSLFAICPMNTIDVVFAGEAYRF
jgi:hypothetical protein